MKKQVTNKPKRNAKGQLLPGSTANPNGRKPSGETLTDLLRSQASLELKPGETYREAVVKAIWKRAAAGDLKAAEIVFDRLEGKPHQTIAQTNEVKAEVRVIE